MVADHQGRQRQGGLNGRTVGLDLFEQFDVRLVGGVIAANSGTSFRRTVGRRPEGQYRRPSVSLRNRQLLRMQMSGMQNATISRLGRSCLAILRSLCVRCSLHMIVISSTIIENSCAQLRSDLCHPLRAGRQ
jgi:hypothetical protein